MSTKVLRIIGDAGAGKSRVLDAYHETLSVQNVEHLYCAGDSTLTGIRQALQRGNKAAVLIDVDGRADSAGEIVSGLVEDGRDIQVVVACGEHPAEQQIEWLQNANGLHRQVDMLYVVDGYEVTVTWDDNAISEAFHGKTLSEAISKAMAGHDLDVRHPFQDRKFKWEHERQIDAVAAQCDQLLQALEDILKDVELHDQISVEFIRSTIAAAKGSAA